MAIYNTGPVWTPLSDITAAKLQQMVDNIQYVKDKVDGINIPTPPTPSISYGVLGRATQTGEAGTIAGVTAVNGSSTVTITNYPGSRLVRHSWSARSFQVTNNSTGAGTWAIRTLRDGNLIGEVEFVFNGGGGDHGGSYFSLDTPAAGDHTYTCQMVRIAGTGDLLWEANSANPSYFIVEDLGAA